MYEGRGRKDGVPFDFSPKVFTGVTDLPLYMDRDGKNVDFPSGSIVAVGYTVGTYKGTQAKVTCLSPNLLFAILLAIPKKPAVE